MSGVLKSLEESLADVQRVDAKAQSALDLKKQNLKDEAKKKKELVKNMEEVTSCLQKKSHIYTVYFFNNKSVNCTAFYPLSGQQDAYCEGEGGF